MQYLYLILWAVTFAALFDIGRTICKCDVFNCRWNGFKVCKNGAIYNQVKKRFATKAEKQMLFCVTEIYGN